MASDIAATVSAERSPPSCGKRTVPSLDFASLTPLISPRSVAIIGASDDATRIGGRPISYMLQRKFPGVILPVNNRRDTIQGLRAYKSIADLPHAPDVAVVAVAAEASIEAIRDLAARGTKAAIAFTSGFAETGAAGAQAQQRMMEIARASGMRILGPNCLGLANSRLNFFPTFTAGLELAWPKPGRISVVSQSGAYGSHLMAVLQRRGIGASLLVTTGNEADVTVAEVIGWMAQDPDTDVIAAYMEGVRSHEGLIAALEAARAARKPVVMMKVGRSEGGKRAALSHTASIAGDDAAFDTIISEFAVVRARTTEEMIDIAETATRRIYPARNSLGILSISGGAGVIASDAADLAGLPMPSLPEATQKRLKEKIPFAATANPVDCTAQVFNNLDLVGEFGEALVQEGGYASILAFFTMVAGAPSVALPLREQLSSVRAKHPDRLFVMSIVASSDIVKAYQDNGFVVFEDISRAVVAIDAMGRFGDAFVRPASAAFRR